MQRLIASFLVLRCLHSRSIGLSMAFVIGTCRAPSSFNDMNPAKLLLAAAMNYWLGPRPAEVPVPPYITR